MRNLLTALILCAIAALPLKGNAQDAYVSYQSFYESLSPYGQWIDDPQYGYVWVPGSVEEDFRPYFSGGHWVVTEYGNTWFSEYPWGWACFHYGRWIYTSYYGWVWVPGNEWGPGWVSWRWGGGYCGWAPLYPGWAYGSEFMCPDDWWIFMHPKHLYKSAYLDIYRADFMRSPKHIRSVMGATQILNNPVNGPREAVYAYGPRPADVEAVTHKPVYTYRVRPSATRGPESISYHELTIYKPEYVRQIDKDGEKPVPPRVMGAPQPLSTRPEQITVRNNSAQQAAPTFRSTYMQPAAGGSPRQQSFSTPRSSSVSNNNTAAPAMHQSQPRSNAGSNIPRPAPAPVRAAPTPAPASGGKRR